MTCASIFKLTSPSHAVRSAQTCFVHGPFAVLIACMPHISNVTTCLTCNSLNIHAYIQTTRWRWAQHVSNMNCKTNTNTMNKLCGKHHVHVYCIVQMQIHFFVAISVQAPSVAVGSTLISTGNWTSSSTFSYVGYQFTLSSHVNLHACTNK